MKTTLIESKKMKNKIMEVHHEKTKTNKNGIQIY